MAPDRRKPAIDAAPAPDARAWGAVSPPLSEWITEATNTMGFARMTPVQASTIPLFTGNKDVVVEAVTGSGKTLAFLIPVIEKLLKSPEPNKRHHIGAIIISPTRELATQIHSVLLSLLAFHPPSASALHPTPPPDTFDDNLTPPTIASTSPRIIPQLLLGGSQPPKADLSTFLQTSPNLLISTPGRLLQLLSSPHVHCPQSSFEVLVLDEADRLLDLGFKDDLQKILQRLPKQRRTGLFSASVSDAVDQLVRVGLRNPVRIAVKVRSKRTGKVQEEGEGELRTPASLRMTYLTVPASARLPALISLLTSMLPVPGRSIAYLSTCAAVDYFQHILPHLFPTNNKIDVIPLHGKHTPAIRQKNFSRFLSASSPALLLTTDLAARGLDIPQVDLTIQLDPPSDPKTFLHRAGRAGRAGRPGLAVVFLLPGRESEDYPPFLAVRRTPVEPLTTPRISITPSIASATTSQIRTLVLADRALHEKAQRAFVSSIRSYSKHEASSIFRIADLPWRDLAEGWGLLRMPRMPELKRATDFAESERDLGLDIDWTNFAFRDAEREKKRRREMEEGPSEDALASLAKRKAQKRKGEGAWSTQQALQKEREQRREKRGKKRDSMKLAKMTESQRRERADVEKMVEEVRRRHQEVDDVEFSGFD